MKTFCFVLLSCFVICLSSNTVQGRLLFTYDTSIASERSNATFICQDTESELSLKVTWSFQSSSVGSILSENGSLAPGINRDKYKLLKSAAKLQVTDLRVNDTGNYTCCIKGENGETLLSATAALLVKAGLRDEHSANTSHGLGSLQHGDVSSSTAFHKLQPSPTAASILSTLMVQSTVYHPTSSVVSTKHTATTDSSQLCGNSTNNTVAFNEGETSPSLITVKEGGKLKLQCSYCVWPPKQAVSLSWYKEDRVILNSSHYVITNHSKVLGVPVVQHNKDEGLYKCVVNSEEQNISKFITVIVKKAESNPLLLSVLAQNKSFLSVQVTWRLTDRGVFTAAQVSFKLRLLESNEWRHHVSNTSQNHGLYRFEHLQPSSVYILNIALHNNDKQTESRTVVFWSAASNSSKSDQRSLVLYQVTNRRALGVALGIIGLLVIIMIIYACVTWCHADKRGYSIPSGQQKRMNENESLFSTNTTLYHNRAFEDDKFDWMDDEIPS
ncbi:hypothetical protein OS493_031116 [Desmophyllum pertusum]|uniref:Ig-like domain-containing protein n=1 Tax=Desmophyllum pertusum TaxID=174260 RepID=A0A9X0CD58_9CNID|nr:hypothetical protein OS493_031116 [Desmophyllum pertusum]